MPRIPYRFPAPGTDAVADRIRERRGARGLTSLDGTLLNAPLVADGWNSFIGTLRTKNSLPDDVRELMILRVAACNAAAFEWIHHEHVARSAGVTYLQLAYIGLLPTPSTGLSSPAFSLPPTHGLSALQLAALEFADASTRQIRVSDEVFGTLKTELSAEIERSGKGEATTVEQQLLESTAVVGGYNLVSRLLIALDVDDKSLLPVPTPVVSFIPVPGCTLHALHIPHATNPSAPTIVFVNSLLTNLSMWYPILPFFTSEYSIILYDQRGHGASTTPDHPCSIPELADDIPLILAHFELPSVAAVIGVSQGGATALSFSIRHPTLATVVVACDTQAASPAANRKAWDDRIELAKKEGMGALERATVPRWFAPASSFEPDSAVGKGISAGVIATTVDGFAAGAAALQGYDLLADGLIEGTRKNFSGGERLLLIAGEMDGALPAGLQKLGGEIGGVQVEVISKGGHLPMVNEPGKWAEVVKEFLGKRL